MMPREPVQISNVGDYRMGVQAAAGSTVVNAAGRTYVKQRTEKIPSTTKPPESPTYDYGFGPVGGKDSLEKS